MKVLKRILRRNVSKAVVTGLREIGDDWRTMLAAESHTAPFPNSGTTLLLPDSAFLKELSNIQQRLDKLDDDNYWEENNADKPGNAPNIEGSANKEDMLKREIAGLPHTCACTTSHTAMQCSTSEHLSSQHPGYFTSSAA